MPGKSYTRAIAIFLPSYSLEPKEPPPPRGALYRVLRRRGCMVVYYVAPPGPSRGLLATLDPQANYGLLMERHLVVIPPARFHLWQHSRAKERQVVPNESWTRSEPSTSERGRRSGLGSYSGAPALYEFVISVVRVRRDYAQTDQRNRSKWLM